MATQSDPITNASTTPGPEDALVSRDVIAGASSAGAPPHLAWRACARACAGVGTLEGARVQVLSTQAADGRHAGDHSSRSPLAPLALWHPPLRARRGGQTETESESDAERGQIHLAIKTHACHQNPGLLRQRVHVTALG